MGYTVGNNTPGYLPDTDEPLAWYSDLDDAIQAWRDEVRYYLDDLDDDGDFLEADTALHVTSDEDVKRHVLEHGGFEVHVRETSGIANLGRVFWITKEGS
jgi:hypothetical protein